MKKNRFGKALGTAQFLFWYFVSSLVWADAPTQGMPKEWSARFAQLEAEIAALQGQVENLKEQIEIQRPRAEEKSVYLPPATSEGPKWLEGMAMKGDLRLRYEAFDQNEATRDRNRFRYRVRWHVEKHLTENVDLGFRIVSGSATDPTSTLQTFTGDFTAKSIFFDLAYAKYRPSFLKESLPFLSQIEIGGGKVENPFLGATSGMVWDSDVNPEGFYESAVFHLFANRVRPFLNLGQFVLQENAAASDAELFAAQTGWRWDLPGFSQDSPVTLSHALAYYDFSDYARDSNFLVSGTSLARGNTRTGSSSALDASDFDILEVYNEATFKLGTLPAKFYVDFATNLGDQARDPLGRNVGYQYGIRLGQAKKKGTWESTYYYGYVEPNAVVGAFSDSDFGAGHADKRGSMFQVRYALTDYLKLSLTAYLANNITGADDETRRLQTDLDWVF